MGVSAVRTIPWARNFREWIHCFASYCENMLLTMSSNSASVMSNSSHLIWFLARRAPGDGLMHWPRGSFDNLLESHCVTCLRFSALVMLRHVMPLVNESHQAACNFSMLCVVHGRWCIWSRWPRSRISSRKNWNSNLISSPSVLSRSGNPSILSRTSAAIKEWKTLGGRCCWPKKGAWTCENMLMRPRDVHTLIYCRCLQPLELYALAGHFGLTFPRESAVITAWGCWHVMLSMIGRDSVPLNVHSIPWSVSLSLTCLSVVNLVSSFTILAENACLSPSTNNPDSLQRCFMAVCDDFKSNLPNWLKKKLEQMNVCSCIVEDRRSPRDVHILANILKPYLANRKK